MIYKHIKPISNYFFNWH